MTAVQQQRADVHCGGTRVGARAIEGEQTRAGLGQSPTRLCFADSIADRDASGCGIDGAVAAIEDQGIANRLEIAAAVDHIAGEMDGIAIQRERGGAGVEGDDCKEFAFGGWLLKEPMGRPAGRGNGGWCGC